jgi:predicted TIM-barrel fold metal-dependent hydrolase
MLDLHRLPVVDSHCHAFLPEKETKSFEEYLTLSDLAIPSEHLTSTLLYRQVLKELSRLLGVRGKDSKVIEERQKLYRRDPADYIGLLFDDAHIETLLVDTGFPTMVSDGYVIGREEFSRLTGAEVREIFRIENVVHNLVADGLPYGEAVERFRGEIDAAVGRGAVALKSIIAYRTGLEVHRWDEEKVKRAYSALLKEVKDGRPAMEVMRARNPETKAVYDSFILTGVEESVRHHVPFQIHAGFGDAPSIDLRLARPILLHDLLNDPAVKDARIVIVHGGYPWVEEAGFMVNSYPNLYIDLSEAIPHSTVGVKAKLLALLEMAPTSKIMYGSDGFNVPELHWIAAIAAKRGLSEALGEIVSSGTLDEEQALATAKRFLSENARRLYDV